MQAYIGVYRIGWCMLDLDCCDVEENDWSYNIIIYIYLGILVYINYIISTRRGAVSAVVNLNETTTTLHNI